ncbi:hypothetical protein SAMN04488508_10391 [Aquimarina spongiae]|uniref:Uncharacterized protein n=1 Tax=Aquimarina spongiae TaxID=570521 RepID=A0A1M6DY94_9FLAO|nr:hypothetical protein SAMN04488508_10391 [Aquimarina spongiae]
MKKRIVKIHSVVLIKNLQTNYENAIFALILVRSINEERIKKRRKI